MTSKRPRRVFLSYGLEDQDRAHDLATALRQRGIETVTLNDDLKTGAPWNDEVERWIRESDGVVCLVSGSAAKSPIVRREWEAALDESAVRSGLALIPVVDPGVEPPGFLRDRRWIKPEATEPNEVRWPKVAEEIEQALTAGADVDAPYRASAAKARKEWTEEMGKAIAPHVQAEKLGSR